MEIDSRKIRIIEIARHVCFHTFLAIAGSTAISFLAMALLGRSGDALLDYIPFLLFPVSWGPGFALGFLVNRAMRDRSACWAWPLSTAWLAYYIWDECRAYRFPPSFPPKGDFVHRAWHMFFTSFNDAKAWGASPLELIFGTLPALGAIGYSLGAWVALGSKGSHDESSSEG
jgi:hypothetical protein